jgi:metal-sulfur cluster biosynthetic enzyme
MTEKTLEEIASDAADTAGPDDATAPAVADAGAAATTGAAAATDLAAATGAAPAAPADSVPAPAAGGTVVSKPTIADIEEAMKDVVDPELGINVVDLGLVYDAHVDDDNIVTLDMTLTSAACPLTDVIEDQTRQALTTGPGGGLVKDFRINWVWLPPWGPDKITDDGREQLRALGFNV